MLSAFTQILIVSTLTFQARVPQAGDELEQLIQRQNEAAIRYDRPALQDTADRLIAFAEAHPDSAAAHFAAALANWQLLFQLSGLPILDNELMGRLTRMSEHLERVLALSPDRADAHALLGLGQMFRALADPSGGGDLRASAQASIERALELEPKSPRVLYIDAFYRAANRRVTDEDVARFEKALARFGETQGEGKADWWHLSAYALTIRIQTMKTPPNFERGEKLVAEALELRPDFRSIAELLAPIVKGRSSLAEDALPELAWRQAAEDPAGDGTNGADGVACAWAHQVAGDWLWLKFTWNGQVNRDSFGVNFIVDTDLDAATGSPWWGANKVSFDRLVSVWVSRGQDGQYRGIVGIGSHTSALAGDPTDEQRGGVDFLVTDEGRSVVIRVPRAQLDADGRMRALAAVGLATGWSDDLPNTGMFDLDLGLEKGGDR